MTYDNWKTTDPREGADGSLDKARCAFWISAVGATCDVPYEDHNDEELGHTFEMPEPEERDVD